MMYCIMWCKNNRYWKYSSERKRPFKKDTQSNCDSISNERYRYEKTYVCKQKKPLSSFLHNIRDERDVDIVEPGGFLGSRESI